MKLKKLIFEGTENLITDPDWFISIHGWRSRVPIQYNQFKARLTEEIKQLNFNNTEEVFKGIQGSSLHTYIDMKDYEQYFQGPQADEFHADDEFARSSHTYRTIMINDQGLTITTSHYGYDKQPDTGEGKHIPPAIIAALQRIYSANKLIMLQAFDSYLRDNGRSIREYGLRIPYYGM